MITAMMSVIDDEHHLVAEGTGRRCVCNGLGSSHHRGVWIRLQPHVEVSFFCRCGAKPTQTFSSRGQKSSDETEQRSQRTPSRMTFTRFHEGSTPNINPCKKKTKKTHILGHVTGSQVPSESTNLLLLSRPQASAHTSLHVYKA